MKSWFARLFRPKPAIGTTLRCAAFKTAGDDLERCDLMVTASASHRHQLVHDLVRIIVLAAQSSRQADDSYHLVLRPPDEPETTLLPLGPHVQALGERAELELARTMLDRRTALWLCLERSVPVAEVVDPFNFDPESEEAIDALLAAAPLRWGAAATVAGEGRLVLARLILWLDPKVVERVKEVSRQLKYP